MKTEILNEAAAAFAELDFSAENARITEIENEIARMTASIEAAEKRCTQISRALIEDRGPDARAVGDALLVEASPTEAASAGSSIAELENERASLRAGIGDLLRRIDEAHREISEIKRKGLHRASQPAKPLVDAIAEDMRDHAKRLLEGYAAISAIRNAAGAAGMTLNAAEAAISGLTGMDRLLPGQQYVDVPAQVAEVLGLLQDKGPALPARFGSKVQVP